MFVPICPPERLHVYCQVHVPAEARSGCAREGPVSRAPTGTCVWGAGDEWVDWVGMSVYSLGPAVGGYGHNQIAFNNEFTEKARCSRT